MRYSQAVPITVLAVVLTACTALRPAPTVVSGNAAVLALVEQARTDNSAGRLTGAAANLERALRIEPQNPRLWQELARLRLAQGDAQQAESLAARANSWAGADRQLRAENWRLIAEARAARGDAQAAQDATERARRLEE